VFADKVQLVSSLSKGFAATTLELLVVLSGILKTDDYRKMGPVLWNKCLDSRDSRIVIPVRTFCYIIRGYDFHTHTSRDAFWQCNVPRK
jgi:hypothetical protein